MKLGVSHYPGAYSVAEEFALTRLARAKRLGLPVPRSVVNLLSEPPPRAHETIPDFAKRIGVPLEAVRYRLRRNMTREQIAGWAGAL